MCLDGSHVVNEYQPIWAAQLSMKIADYALNKSFHSDGSSSVTVFRHCRGSLETQQLIKRNTDEIVVYVFDSFMFGVVHPMAIWRGRECFLCALVSPMRREGRDCSPMNSFLGNFCNGIRFFCDLFGYFRWACPKLALNHSFLSCLATTSNATSRLSSSSSLLIISGCHRRRVLSRKNTTDRLSRADSTTTSSTFSQK